MIRCVNTIGIIALTRRSVRTVVSPRWRLTEERYPKWCGHHRNQSLYIIEHNLNLATKTNFRNPLMEKCINNKSWWMNPPQMTIKSLENERKLQLIIDWIKDGLNPNFKRESINMNDRFVRFHFRNVITDSRFLFTSIMLTGFADSIAFSAMIQPGTLAN